MTVTWLIHVHMTLTFSSPILIRAARSSAQSIPRPILSSATIISKLSITRNMSDASKAKSEQEWRAILTPEQVCHSTPITSVDSTLQQSCVQFRVLRSKGTEAPGTGEYEHNKAAGIYSCAGCNTPLYKSNTKFDSGCGWPAFFDGNNSLRGCVVSQC